ncbi:MAG: TraB/GumN family protein [Hyphomonadaceae bacterium]
MRLLRVALLFLCWALAAPACAPPPAPADPALWRVADGDSEIWLFGGVHVLAPHFAWRSRRVNAAFDTAETVVFEADLDAMNADAFNALVRREGLAARGQTLSSRLNAEEQARLRRAAARVGVDPEGLEPLRPWLAALQLTLAFSRKSGGDPANGVEAVLGAEARRRGKRLMFLETPEAQIRTLAGLSPAAEHAFLVASLRQIERGPGPAQNMDEAWRRGDTATLARLLHDDIAEAGDETYAALVTRRNARFAEKIRAMLAGRGRIFVAVGAAHLVGPDGVPALLRAQGLMVEGP